MVFMKRLAAHSQTALDRLDAQGSSRRLSEFAKGRSSACPCACTSDPPSKKSAVSIRPVHNPLRVATATRQRAIVVVASLTSSPRQDSHRARFLVKRLGDLQGLRGLSSLQGELFRRSSAIAGARSGGLVMEVCNTRRSAAQSGRLATRLRLLSGTSMVAIVLASPAATAGEAINARTILNIGCHNFDATCFVELSGSQFGGALACPSGVTSEFRFDNADSDPGKRTYATMLSAFVSGKAVSVMVDGCSVHGWPKLQYFRVHD